MKKLMVFLLILVAESAYPNAANLQKIPATVNRAIKHPGILASWRVIHILRATKAELRGFLEGNWRDEVDEPELVQRVEEVVKLKINGRTDREILGYMMGGWQDDIKALSTREVITYTQALTELRNEILGKILLEGTFDEVNTIIYIASKEDHTVLSEEQLIELIDRGITEDPKILTAIILNIARSEYWAKKTAWINHFFAVVDDPELVSTLEEVLRKFDGGWRGATITEWA